MSYNLLKKVKVTTRVLQSVLSRQWPFHGRHFENLYQAAADPWKVSIKKTERDKYEATLSLLPRDRRFEALEIGCSEGVFTAMLAQRCDLLLAVDISPTALNRARVRCRALPHVHFVCCDALRLKGERLFDLITIMEMLYYLPAPRAIQAMCDACLAMLRPGGFLLLTHLLGWGNYLPYTRGLSSVKHGAQARARQLAQFLSTTLGIPVMARAPELHQPFRDAFGFEVVKEVTRPEFQSLLLQKRNSPLLRTIG